MIKKIITISFLSIFILGFATPIVFAQDQVYDFQLNQNSPSDFQLNQNKSLDKSFEDELSNTDTNQDADQMSGGITITASQVPNIINKVARWLYTIVLALSTIFGLYAAFLYLTGDPKNVEKAKKQLIYAVIGVVVAIFAFSINAIIRGIIR